MNLWDLIGDIQSYDNISASYVTLMDRNKNMHTET